MNPLLFICFFTFIIHMTESLAYSMRLAGVRTKQLAIAMAFVTSTLLISRLSNMFQAPLLGSLVDGAILEGSKVAVELLVVNFRWVIFSAFLGAAVGAFLTPTIVLVFQKGIYHFLEKGSMPKMIIHALKPSSILYFFRVFRLPAFSMLKKLSWRRIPKGFLIINVFVTSIYCIGVLCSLSAGAYLPEFRSTAIQLSGIVNGMATIMFTLFVDPSGARVTDQAMHDIRPMSDVKSVIFFLQCGKIVGTLIVAQLFFYPLTQYIMTVTRFIASWAI
jgi:hypothetical protein